ncbi:hypothetical protein [Streptosporangium roseum]|uniref:hypothetical protein n=1 Tax=Streptosporangium roseum TaxID=2001 RepID=UPI0004CCC51F|nr:hypothetical protein [Streptosporangium roseum]
MTTPNATDRRREIALSMTGRELRQLLGAVLQHAGTDPAFPSLTVVTFDAEGAWLYVLATDRYTLGVARHRMTEGASAPFTLTVAAATVQAIVRQIKPCAAVRLTLTGEGLTIDQLDPQVTYRLPASGERPVLPNWRVWFAERLAEKPAAVLTSAHGIALNPAYLARFRSACRDGLPLEMRPAGRHVAITCGEHFLGLIGPMDLSKTRAASPDPLADWLPALPSRKAAA